MWHGCGAYSVDRFLEGKPARERELYDALVGFVGGIGPFDQVPTKTRIAFMVDVRFLAVYRVRRDGLSIHLWMKRQLSSPRFTKVEHLGRRDWIHHLVLRSEAELDEELLAWMREAYDIGRRAHLERSARDDVSGTRGRRRATPSP